MRPSRRPSVSSTSTWRRSRISRSQPPTPTLYAAPAAVSPASRISGRCGVEFEIAAAPRELKRKEQSMSNPKEQQREHDEPDELELESETVKDLDVEEQR